MKLFQKLDNSVFSWNLFKTILILQIKPLSNDISLGISRKALNTYKGFQLSKISRAYNLDRSSSNTKDGINGIPINMKLIEPQCRLGYGCFEIAPFQSNPIVWHHRWRIKSRFVNKRYEPEFYVLYKPNTTSGYEARMRTMFELLSSFSTEWTLIKAEWCCEVSTLLRGLKTKRQQSSELTRLLLKRKSWCKKKMFALVFIILFSLPSL